MVQVGPGWTKPASVHGFPGPEFSRSGKLGRKEIEPSLGLYVKKNNKTKHAVSLLV